MDGHGKKTPENNIDLWNYVKTKGYITIRIPLSAIVNKRIRQFKL